MTRRANGGGRADQCFWLDGGCLSAYLIINGGELPGFDSSDERGFAAGFEGELR